MKNRVRPLTVSPRPEAAINAPQRKWRHVILAGAIAPAGLVLTTTASAADRVVPPSFTIDADTGTPVYAEGLREGFLNGAANVTDANPGNSSPELTLRMGQSTATGPDAWGDNRTWVYTGQIFTGPNGIISIAANNDDMDYFSIAGGLFPFRNDTWNVPNAWVATGLGVNTWVDFEYRVGNGGGGAGPSAQNTEGGLNWNGTTGVVMSYEDETDPITFMPSLDALAYNLGRPSEPAGGGPTLFRYQNGFGFDDDLRVTGSGTITIDGETNVVTEPSLRFENAADATLTVNDGTGTHKTLAFSGGTTLASNTAPAVIAGTSDVRLGRVTDAALTGVRVIAAGPGRLIIDHVDNATPSDMNGTTLEAGAGGRLVIQGSNNRSPLISLTTPLTISGTGGTINIGTVGAGLSYNNAISALESGTLEHTTNTADTVGSFANGITVAAGKTLTVKNSANTFTIAGNVTGAAVTNDSTSLVRYTGGVTLDTFTNAQGTAQLRGNTTLGNLNVSGGRLESFGNLSVSTVPVIANGATLAVLNTTNAGTFPNPITVPTGNLEFVPGGLGATTVALTGGTISLAPQFTGLVGNYYNLTPNNDGTDRNGDFMNYGAYTSFFDGVTATVGDVLTSVGNTEVLSFDPAGGDTAMFSKYGFNSVNQIISRMSGKIRIPTTGLYTFSTRSDDGSVVFINGALAVDNNYYQGMTMRTGTILLSAGLHDIDIGYYEEGGGNGLEVFWSGPGIANTLLPNAVLSPDVTSTFSSPIDVQNSSTINSVTAKAVLPSLTVQPGVTLSTNGPDIVATTMTLNGAGAYTIDTAAGTTLTANDIASNGAVVNINKTGPGVFAVDDLTSASPQFPLGSSITVSQGALGVLLGGATNPLGNATVTFNGGGVVLSSKGGNQSFAIPAFTGNGSIEARQIASGIAGTPETPVEITLTGNLNVTASQSVTLGTDDNYVLNLGGAAEGTGTVIVNGGTVVDTSGTALQNLAVALNTKGRTADLIINSNTPTLGSLSSNSSGTGSVRIGTGTGTSTLTFNGAGAGSFVGNITTNANAAYSIVKNGTGTQSIVAPLGGTVETTPTAITINAGALELSPGALGSAPINLAGGTLKMVDNGLTLKIWSSNPVNTGAYGTTLNTFAGVQAHYANLPSPAFIGNTAANDNMFITYNPGAQAENTMFGIHEYFEQDNIQAMFTGKIFVPTAGDYKFSPRSDDGSTVYINGQPVSLNNFAQGIGDAAQPGRDGTIALTAGYHDILMTFNEGTGGHGFFVDITGPDGLVRRLSNTELFTTDVTATNSVNLTTSSSVDAQGGVMSLGTLNWTAGTTLTSASGTTAFGTTALPGAGVYAISGSGNVQPGNITVPANAAVTLHNTGTGGLILNNTTTSHLQNSASVVLADGGGRVILVTDTSAGGTNPLGSAILRLGGANGSGELVISTKFPENFTVSPNLQIQGNILLTAGNAGGGAVSGVAALPIEATISNSLNYGANSVTLRSNSSYALRVGGAVTGTGPLVVTGGDVTTAAAVTAGSVSVTGGRLNTAGSLTAATATVSKGATLRLSGAANLSGGTSVTEGTLEVNGTAYTGGNINLDGGYVDAVGGVTDLSGVAVNGSAKATVANALTGRLYSGFTAPRGGFGTDQGLINTLSAKPAFSRTLDSQALNFGPNSAGDAAIASFFETSAANAVTFTMTFTGNFTAAESGVHSFRENMVDDNGSFWVDLNQNGFFELDGSAGSELLAQQGCCGPADPDTSVGTDVTLVAGQTYKVAMVVEDAGGSGSYAARFSTPSIQETFVQPGSQAGLWSTTTGGGSIRVASDSELVLGQANNIENAVFTGTNGVLRFNNSAARNTDVALLRSDTDFGMNTVDLGPNDTMTATLVLVNDGSTMRKIGGGTLNAGTIGLAGGSMLEVSGGRAVIHGPGVGEGSIVANGTGTAVINGTISGAIRAEAGGTIGGAGTVGNADLEGGTLAPGDSGVGTLTTGALNAIGGTIALDITGPGQGDRIAAASVSLVSDVAITLNLGTYNPVVQGPGNFVVLENLGGLPITGLGDATDIGANSLLTFEGNRLAQNESFLVNGVEMRINYFGGTGNDIVLSAIPEPGTVGALLCGVGSLLSMRLRRRRS